MIGIAIGFGVSVILMYGRKKIPLLTRGSIATICLIAGLYGLLIKQMDNKDFFMIFWGMMTVGLYFGLDRLLYMINVRFQKRDFILWLRGSSEIRDFDRNPHVNWVDKLSSIISLVFIAFLMGLGAHLSIQI